jgi:hypothetical protein
MKKGSCVTLISRYSSEVSVSKNLAEKENINGELFAGLGFW